MEPWTEVHKRYEESPDVVRFAVDDAFDAVQKAVAARGFKALGDDKAERLVTAIFLYLEDCNTVPVEQVPGN